MLCYRPSDSGMLRGEIVVNTIALVFSGHMEQQHRALYISTHVRGRRANRAHFNAINGSLLLSFQKGTLNLSAAVRDEASSALRFGYLVYRSRFG